ncbi:hypothetical protein [Kutzneria sp. 744]|nr:hypothetical protein [Kutzneria sp. 744]
MATSRSFGRALYQGLVAGADPYPLDTLERRPVPAAVIAHHGRRRHAA